MKVLITGGTGFLGTALYPELVKKHRVSLLGRSKPKYDAVHFDIDFIGGHDLSNCLRGVDVVIHCAARAHVMSENSDDPLSDYRKVNVAGTKNLAEQAASMGVKRFIYISSVKVNGERTHNNTQYNESSPKLPEDAYGKSKMEAEDCLEELSKSLGLEVTIIRPPLIYGPNVKGNFLRLLSLAKRRLPLPFGIIENKRSMVYIGNLVDFICKCVEHPKAANQTFLISDGKDLSIASLLSKMRKSNNCRPLLFPVPKVVFEVAGKLTGKSDVIARLVGSLRVNSSKANELLDWEPPFSVDEGLRSSVKWFNEK